MHIFVLNEFAKRGWLYGKLEIRFNWGLVGIFNYNLVDALFGTMSWVSRIIYTLVGIAGVWAIAFYGYGDGRATQKN